MQADVTRETAATAATASPRGEYGRLSEAGRLWFAAMLDPDLERSDEDLAGARRLHRQMSVQLSELFRNVGVARGLEGRDVFDAIEIGLRVAWAACLAVGAGRGLTPELARRYVLNRTLSLWRWSLRVAEINPRVYGRGQFKPIAEAPRRCRFCGRMDALWEVQERSGDSIRVIAICSRCRNLDDQAHRPGRQAGVLPDGRIVGAEPSAREQLLRERNRALKAGA